MFLIRKPSATDIDRFLDRLRGLSLSYASPGIVSGPPAGYSLDEVVVTIGHGSEDFDRARAALLTWKQCDLGWLRVFPSGASIEPGTNIAIRVQQLGFWSLNGGRVLDCADGPGDRFSVTYGTLTDHAESGEESFEVFMDPPGADVRYRIRAVSRPRALLARLGYPIVRRLQTRFRRDSIAAMTRTTSK